MNLKELLDVVKLELRDLSSLENPDFRLEQAEFKQEDEVWEIVISYLVDNTNPRNNSLLAISSEFKYHRIYKKIKIDKNKEILGFYIFEHQ